MTIAQKIYEESKDLAAWQQDAIAQHYADQSFGAANLDGLYAVAKMDGVICEH